MKTRLRKCLARSFALLLGCAFALALLEVLCSIAAWIQFGTLNVKELNAATFGDVYTAQTDGFVGAIEPHPYLGWSNREGNTAAFGGTVPPLRRNPQAFTILLTGGSVAGMLSKSGELERALSRYDFQKPVVVINGGNGAWKQPHQFILTGLYADVVDAVVTLDGFNEMNQFKGYPARLELPYNNFASINPLVENGYDRLGASWECQRLRTFSHRCPSRLVFYVTYALRSRIAANAPPASSASTRLYDLPQSWSDDERIDYNLEQYRKYLRSIDALAGVNGCKVAHFLQPVPAIGKKLTDEEQRAVGELDYAETYRHMAEQLPTISLLDCFDRVDETVYVDRVHNNQRGQQIMAERIAAELAKLWTIPENPPAAKGDGSVR